MTMKRRVATVLWLSGRTMTLGEIKGAMREMFAMTFTTEESAARTLGLIAQAFNLGLELLKTLLQVPCAAH
jgi:hypothetical protein